MPVTNDVRLKTALGYDLAKAFDASALQAIADCANTRADILRMYAQEESAKGKGDRDFGYMLHLLQDMGEFQTFAAHCAAMARHAREFE